MTEAEEKYQHAGDKGRTPPRLRTILTRRANKVKGYGTGDTDRPPIAGVVGRESG